MLFSECDTHGVVYVIFSSVWGMIVVSQQVGGQMKSTGAMASVDNTCHIWSIGIECLCVWEVAMQSYHIICWGVENDWLSYNESQSIQMLLLFGLYLPGQSYPCFTSSARPDVLAHLLVTSLKIFVCTKWPKAIYLLLDDSSFMTIVGCEHVSVPHTYWICGDCHLGQLTQKQYVIWN